MQMDQLKIDDISAGDFERLQRSLYKEVDRLPSVSPYKKPNYFIVFSMQQPRAAFKRTVLREFVGSYLRIGNIGLYKTWKINLCASLN